MPMDPNHARRLDEIIHDVLIVPFSDGSIDKLILQDGSVLLDFDDLTFKATANSVAPVITPGVATTGTVMSSTTGTWDHNPLSYAYQWYKGANPINGATNPAYTVVVGDLASEITCKVAATNRAGASAAVASNGVTPAA